MGALDLILPVLADPGIPDEQVGGLLRGQIGMGRIREAAAAGWPALPLDNYHRTGFHHAQATSVLALAEHRGSPGKAAPARVA